MLLIIWLLIFVTIFLCRYFEEEIYNYFFKNEFLSNERIVVFGKRGLVKKFEVGFIITVIALMIVVNITPDAITNYYNDDYYGFIISVTILLSIIITETYLYFNNIFITNQRVIIKSLGLNLKISKEYYLLKEIEDFLVEVYYTKKRTGKRRIGRRRKIKHCNGTLKLKDGTEVEINGLNEDIGFQIKKEIKRA